MQLSNKIRGTIQLFRPELPFAAGVCVVLGEIVAVGRFPSLRESILGFLCGFFISGSALTLNDYFDLEVDRINAPARPIPAGLITRSDAVVITIIATVIGLVSSLLISPSALILCILFWIIGFLYNWRFKEKGLLGNIMVSSSVAITFILGGITVGQAWNKIVWFFGLTAFIIDLAEEIAGDAMDMEGDKKRNSKSIALVQGRDFALRTSAILFFFVVCLGFTPVILGWLGVDYLIIVSCTGSIVLFFTGRLLKSQSPQEGRSSMRGIYLGILFGMIAFMFYQFFI